MARSATLLALLEPDDAVREALTTLLEGTGWTVLPMESAKRLGEALAETRPLAVVSESTLPDASAASILDECHRHQVPVVFLGHQADVQSAVDLVRMGAQDFLEKPFPQARLLNLLESLAREGGG